MIAKRVIQCVVTVLVFVASLYADAPMMKIFLKDSSSPVSLQLNSIKSISFSSGSIPVIAPVKVAIQPSVRILPGKTTTGFALRGTAGSKGMIKIFGLDGRSVFMKIVHFDNNGNASFNVHSFSNGVYFVRYQNDKSIILTRLATLE